MLDQAKEKGIYKNCILALLGPHTIEGIEKGNRGERAFEINIRLIWLILQVSFVFQMLMMRWCVLGDWALITSNMTVFNLWLQLLNQVFLSVPDLWVCRTAPLPLQSEMFSISCSFGKFGKIVCMRPLEGWRPSYAESWMRPCLSYLLLNLWPFNNVCILFIDGSNQGIYIITDYICLTSLTRAKPKEKMTFPA